MRRTIEVLSFFAIINATSCAKISRERLRALSDEVNAKSTSWTAGNNFNNVGSYLDTRFLLGALPSDDNPKPRNGYSTYGTRKCLNVGLPINFDAREYWKECHTSLNHVYNQGYCVAGWYVATVYVYCGSVAVSVASAFTDRLCIKTNATALRSAQQLLSCVGGEKMGCKGGHSQTAWEYIVNQGVTTGGDYNSKMGCQPYLIEPWSDNENDTKKDLAKTPECKNLCYNKEYKTDFNDDKVKALEAYNIKDGCEAQKEIFRKGPIVAKFLVYEDFIAYKSGVYQYVTGEFLGAQVVRVIGYGTEKDVPYWLAVNSWDKSWGDKGTFKMRRGSNEVLFEIDFSAAEV